MTLRSRPTLAVLALIAALLSGCGGYSTEGSSVYYRGTALSERSRIDGADVATFKALSRNHARDRYRAYYWGNPIEGADPGSFEEIDKAFAKDKLHVYHQLWRIEGADPDSFEVISGDIGRDQRSAYVSTKAAQTCDLPSLHTEGAFMLDDACVYDRSLNRMPGADRPSFALLTYDIARDHTSLYTDRLTPGDRGYPHIRRVSGICDLPSFHERQGWLVDKQCVYSHAIERAQSIDTSSFVILDERYAKDRGRVYYQNHSDGIRVIDGAIPASFRLDAGTCPGCARDQRQCYSDGHVSTCTARQKRLDSEAGGH